MLIKLGLSASLGLVPVPLSRTLGVTRIDPLWFFPWGVEAAPEGLRGLVLAVSSVMGGTVVLVVAVATSSSSFIVGRYFCRCSALTIYGWCTSWWYKAWLLVNRWLDKS